MWLDEHCKRVEGSEFMCRCNHCGAEHARNGMPSHLWQAHGFKRTPERDVPYRDAVELLQTAPLVIRASRYDLNELRITLEYLQKNASEAVHTIDGKDIRFEVIDPIGEANKGC